LIVAKAYNIESAWIIGKAYEIIDQNYEIIGQDYEIIGQDYEIIGQDYEIICQNYEIIGQDYEINLIIINVNITSNGKTKSNTGKQTKDQRWKKSITTTKNYNNEQLK